MDNSKELLKRALIEALSEKYIEAVEKSADESAEYSYAHYKKMCALIGTRIPAPANIRRIRRRIVASLIAAAVLLLIGCSALVYKDQIGSFLTEIFDDHIKGSFTEENAGNNQFISEYYTLTYVPEGYELVDEVVTDTFVQFTYEASNKAQMVFMQTPIKSVNYFMDNDTNAYATIVIDMYTVYFRRINGTYTYIWNNGEYSFMTYVNDAINHEEIVKLIESIELIQ